ncbi:PQQ-binding-like beta-propeller repeat protein [Siccirubricoccus deserti]
MAGDSVFLLTTGGDLVCLGRDDGRVRWLRPLGRYRNEAKRRDPITWGAPVLAGGRILAAGNHGQLVEVNPADGEAIGQQRLYDGSTQQPAVVDGTLYLLTDNATLVALRGAG